MLVLSHCRFAFFHIALFGLVLMVSGCSSQQAKLDVDSLATASTGPAASAAAKDGDNSPSYLQPKAGLVPQVITIRDDPGGRVIIYKLQMMKFRGNGTELKFSGRCDSACTIYLALPRTQTCINLGASFGFHAPVAATTESSQRAQDYLLETYPQWVKSWIAAKGGLTKSIITIDYSYASQFLDRCDQKVARLADTNKVAQPILRRQY